MSGGSLEYAYGMLDNTIDRARYHKLDKVQKAFVAHLVKVSQALHDMEWVLSADYGPGDDHMAILKCITNIDILSNQVDEAKDVLKELQETVDSLSKPTIVIP